MNILFSAGYLSNIPFANNNIEILLADTLAKKGHKCFVTGISYDEDVKRQTADGTVIRSTGINPFFKKSTDCLENFLRDYDKEIHPKMIKKFILRHPLYSLAVFALKTDYPFKALKKNYVKNIKKFVKKEKIDAVIGFCYPFDMAYLILTENLKAKKIYYQFDPHGMHELLDKSQKEKRIEDETRLISVCDAVFTTKVLKKQYSQNDKYNKYIDKITGVDFPVLVKKTPGDLKIPFDFSKDNINILFCGTMDDGFRNPDFVLSNFEEIFKIDSSVKVHFLGPQQGVKITQWAEKYPDNIFVHPGVKNDIAVSTTYQSDILLNIGNSISNMVPSKIFDYFATGKPIVNVQKIENSPDMEYFEKYPLQFTLKEYENRMDYENLYSFIKNNKNSSISFDKVKQIYETATPEYVAGLIEQALR